VNLPSLLLLNKMALFPIVCAQILLSKMVVLKRKHRHILDTVRALLLSASIPEHFWGEAALTTVYTINRVSSPTTLNRSPYELLYGSPPDYQSLRIFGCVCFVLLPPHERTKLEPRSRLCCFLGYDIEHKGYCCYDPISKRLCISRHVTFWEHRFFSSMESFPSSPSSSSPIFTNVSFDLLPETTDLDAGMTSSPDDITMVDPNAPAPPVDPPTLEPDISVPRCSTRVTALPSHLRDYHCYFALATLHEPHSFVRLILTLFGRMLCPKNLMPFPKPILGT
jgi:hypothetical protein